MAEKEKEMTIKERLKKRTGISDLTEAAMITIYVGVIILAEVHNWNLMTRTINWSGEFWLLQFLASIVGMVSLGLAALFGLKMIEKSVPGLHRNVAYTFYGVDLILILFNWLVDAATNSGNIGQLPNWLVVWNNVIVPITPIWVMLGVAAYKLTDPENRRRDETLRYAQAVRDQVFAKAIESSDNPENVKMIEDKAKSVSNSITRNAVQEIDDVIDGVWRVAEKRPEQPKLPEFRPMPSQFPREDLPKVSSRPVEGLGGFPMGEKTDFKPTRVESGNNKEELKAVLLKAKALVKPEKLEEMLKWLDGKSKNMEAYSDLHETINKAIGAKLLDPEKAKSLRDELRKIKSSLGE